MTEPLIKLLNCRGVRSGFAWNFIRRGTELHSDRLAGEAEDGMAILKQDAEPFTRTHLRKIDPAERKAGKQVHQPVCKAPAFEPGQGCSVRLWVIRGRPCLPHFSLCLLRRKTIWRVSHYEGFEIEPMLGTSQSPSGRQPVVERRSRIRGEQPENG